jgi:hypothetical protein
MWHALHRLQVTHKKKDGLSKNVTRGNADGFSAFVSASAAAGNNSCMSLSAASRLPSHAAVGMPPRDSACAV